MPAKSKAQQRFMGMVHAVQKGELSPSKVSDKVKDVADNMSDSDAEDFASTKHKGKPEKVAKEVIRKVRETIKPIVEDWWAKSSNKTKSKYIQKHGSAPNTAKGDGEDKDAKGETSSFNGVDYEKMKGKEPGVWDRQAVNNLSASNPEIVKQLGLTGDNEKDSPILKKLDLKTISKIIDKYGDDHDKESHQDRLKDDHGIESKDAKKMDKDMDKAAGDANEKMAKDDFESAIDNGEGQWVDELVKMNSDNLPKGVQKDAEEALYAIQDAEMGMGGDADWAKDYLKKNVLPHIKVGEQTPEENIKESFASMFGEFTKHMRSSYEVQAAKDLTDEYDIGKVLYVFRTNRRAFDKAIKDKMMQSKTFNRAKKLKEINEAHQFTVKYKKKDGDDYYLKLVDVRANDIKDAVRKALSKIKSKEEKVIVSVSQETKKDFVVEGKRATKGFDKVYKTRRDFLISWGDFRKKLGDMGTDPRIFKLEGELYKFELKFVKESAKIMQFMQKLAKSKITEGKINEIDYENIFADMGDKLSDFKMKVVKPGMRIYNKGKAKSYMRDLYKSLEKCVDLCDEMNLMANESVVEQWKPYKPLLEKIIKIKKDPHKGVKNTAKGKKFNPLLLKGEDKIKALVWSGSHPTGKGSYEIKGNKLNVMGLNPRDKGFYVSHFTKNTGIRRGNLYYDGVHWQGKKNF